jgi:hypothetical protein
VQTPVIKATAYERLRHQNRVGVDGDIKQKGIEAPNIEIEMEDCEECTTTLSFYVISGSDLSHSPHGGRES